MLCNRIGLTKAVTCYTTLMQAVEKNRRYLVIRGGACLVALARKRGRQQRSRSGHHQRRQSRSLPERIGGRNNEYNASRCITMHYMTSSGARCALTRYEVIPLKGGNIRKNIPGVSRFRTDESEGESCVFDMLELCGGRTGCVSGFVSSF